MIFEWKQGLIWISFDIKYGETWYTIPNCVLDTGSATTAIDIKLIDFDYHRGGTLKELTGIGGGIQQVVSQQVTGIVLDQMELPAMDIEFGELQREMGINGFIGTDILRLFKVTIDFAQKSITLLS